MGTLVTGIHCRHPAVLANMAATLDVISGGRLELGIGVLVHRAAVEVPMLGEPGRRAKALAQPGKGHQIVRCGKPAARAHGSSPGAARCRSLPMLDAVGRAMHTDVRSSSSGQRGRALAMAAGVEVIQMSRVEYERARDAALAELGLTYDELAAQARSGRFQSLRARKLWLAIGRRAPGA
jgi:hypothetical protein